MNARLVAANRGIKLTERRTPRSGSYPNLFTLRVGDFEAAGTVLMEEPHVLRIGAFRLDFVPEGRFLVSFHHDRPGVVGHFGTVLGRNDVNIASMLVGRDAPRGHALMILAVDEPVREEVQAELRAFRGLSDLKYLELG